jgi:hypothetical protein
MRVTIPNYDMPLARRLANSALHAYDSFDTIKDRGDIPIYEPRYDLQAVIELRPDCTILSYRGTRSIENWKVDLTAIPNSQGVHNGFYEGFEAIDPLVTNHLPVQSQTNGRITYDFDRTKPLYATGHSLGGALAVLAAARYNPTALYTFGQPRIYTTQYIKRHRQDIKQLNHWRIVDREDMVSHVPGLLLGYRHTGNLALISSLGDFELNPPLARQIKGHIRGLELDICRIFTGHWPQWVLIRDHSMSLYTDMLSKIVY